MLVGDFMSSQGIGKAKHKSSHVRRDLRYDKFVKL